MEEKISTIIGGRKLIVIVAGVSGVGKSTIGSLLAKKMGILFIEGDEFHSQENIDKMQSNIPLTDEDRLPWICRLRDVIYGVGLSGESAVLSCSALKEKYRKILVKRCGDYKMIWLYGDQSTIEKRVKKRDNHFMKVDMIKSQFNDIETPNNAICINISQSKGSIMQEILSKIEKHDLLH